MIPKYSVLVRHGFMQPAAAGCRNHHALRYHFYLIPEENDSKDAVKFDHSIWIGCMVGLKVQDAGKVWNIEEEDGKS